MENSYVVDNLRIGFSLPDFKLFLVTIFIILATNDLYKQIFLTVFIMYGGVFAVALKA